MVANGLTAVRAEVRAYVDRGLLREFREKQGRTGWCQWEFVWLTPRPFVLRYDPSPATLTFRDLLPKTGRAAVMADEVKAFVAGRSAVALPAYRRIDPARADVRWVTRRGHLSLVIRIKGREYKYGCNKAFNLVNELFVLLGRSYALYLENHFGVSKE